MVNILRKLFEKKQEPRFSDKRYLEYEKLKEKGLESVLGRMHNFVNHAIIPFQVGGAVDMYFFPNMIPGTGFATMEMIEPDGTGPIPSKIGTYELVAFTRHKINEEVEKVVFDKIERRMCGIFSVVGRYSREAQLNPRDTVEVPVSQNTPNACLILDEFITTDVDFMIGAQKHGLLLVIEVFRSEMEYAMKYGSQIVLDELKNKDFYPYSDLDREPVF